MKRVFCLGAFVLVVGIASGPVAALEQAAQGRPAPAAPQPVNEPVSAPGIAPPADYVIGPEDVLEVVFWREKDLSGQVMVRPDGMVSLPLLNDVQAAGLTPEEFRQKLLLAAARYVETPSATVIVRTINSRKVYVTGEVAKPGAFPLGGPLTVAQLISLAGGPKEYADTKNIAVVRMVKGKPVRFKFNLKDYAKGKNPGQDIQLKPGDTVVVP